jgi:hypothetical protein
MQAGIGETELANLKKAPQWGGLRSATVTILV